MPLIKLLTLVLDGDALAGCQGGVLALDCRDVLDYKVVAV